MYASNSVIVGHCVCVCVCEFAFIGIHGQSPNGKFVCVYALGD